MTSRRTILRYLGLSGAASSILLGTYSYHRGVRLPTLHWDPLVLGSAFNITGAQTAVGEHLIQTPVQNTSYHANASFRAFAPEPRLELHIESGQKLKITISNISPEAELEYSAENTTVREETDNITRILVIDATSPDTVSIKWSLPKWSNYTFASIGDTGGDKELLWCLKRAHALGAKFLLHLGDFNYQDSDYTRSISAFNNALIPVYVSIGNHDFHDNGALYQRFIDEIGPLNNTFNIGSTRFVNIDTAANILPYDAGQRGEMFKLMEQDNRFTDTVAFTHRPLHDPAQDSHHDIGSDGERDWLIQALKRVNAKTLLSGHIHIYDRRDFDGIDNIIAGQGLGHQDLLVNGDASKMVLGHVNHKGEVQYTAEPLAMPMEAHCHPRIDPVKESLRDGEHEIILKQLEKACKN